jgi:hypothetical protein
MTPQYEPGHYAEHDPTFLADLEKSKEAVERTAVWLRSFGYTVNVQPVRARPDEKQMAAYSDHGDLAVVHRVEVKRLSTPFTSAEDFPFPNVIVDTAHTWEKARPKPLTYYLWNPDMTCVIIIGAHTRPQWLEKELWDGGKKRQRRFLLCPKALARFVKVRHESEAGPATLS